MASFSIHLAAGKIYATKNSINDLDLFYKGIVDPDLAEDKFVSHYTGVKDKENLVLYLENKTQLYQFLKEHKIDNDYNKGIFVHLITDYLFFNDFFDKEYIRNIDYSSFLKDLYFSYDETNDYLITKYNIDLSMFKDKIDGNIKKDKSKKIMDLNNVKLNNILDYKELDALIEKISNIDLIDYSNKIIKTKNNVLPS